jgi:hypothetical protein
MGHLDQVSADSTAIGFDFQDYVAVHKLLLMRDGQSVGWEQLDDVHIEDDSELCLIQVKHTVNRENITERDVDLWKTLANWVKTRPEIEAGRTKRIRYIIYTNKGYGRQSFIGLLQQDKKNVDEILKTARLIFDELIESEKKKAPGDAQNPLLKHVDTVVNGDDRCARLVLESLKLEAGSLDITKKIDDQLVYMAVPSERAEMARNMLLGVFVAYKYKKVQSREKVVLNYKTFREQLGVDRCLRLAMSTKVNFDEYYNRSSGMSFDDTGVESSLFARQLLDIGFEKLELVDRGIEMFQTQMFIDELKGVGGFTDLEDQALELKALGQWRELHKRRYRDFSGDEAEHIKAGRECYYLTMDKKLSVQSNEMPEEMSRGKYIKLSNHPKLGWRNDWEARFVK